jgi:methyl coenzyme M reductase subunit D
VIEVIEELRNDEIENGVVVNKIIHRLSKREDDIVETICSEYLSKTFNLNNGKISKI